MVTLARHAMRTRFEIVLADDGEPARLRAAGEAALDEIERVEAQLSAYQPGSDLFLVNTQAADGPVRIEPRFFRFLQRAALLYEETDGAFDLAIGALLQLWGWADKHGTPKLPDPTDVQQAQNLTGLSANVVLDEEAGTVRFRRPGVRLDPGAIGKGYALERAAGLLREVGVERALLHGGTSTVCALGNPAGSSAWEVAIQDPLRAGKHLARVSLRDQALSVSAVHGKSFWAQGRRFGHVIDGRTGWPVQNSVLAAVVADSPTDTDALSTALLVLGAAGLPLLASRSPGASFLIADEAASGALRVQTIGDAFLIEATASC